MHRNFCHMSSQALVIYEMHVIAVRVAEPARIRNMLRRIASSPMAITL